MLCSVSKSRSLAAGARPEDVVKLNTYIANYTPEDRAAYDEAKRKVFTQDDLPASTMAACSRWSRHRTASKSKPSP